MQEAEENLCLISAQLFQDRQRIKSVTGFNRILNAIHNTLIAVLYKTATSSKSVIGNSCNAIPNRNTRELIAVEYGIASTATHSSTIDGIKIDGGQITAICKSAISYACYAAANSNGCETGAIVKSIIPYTCNAVGNSNGSKRSTTLKSAASDTRSACSYLDLFNFSSNSATLCRIIVHCFSTANGKRAAGRINGNILRG